MNESLISYCRRLGIEPTEKEVWYRLPEYLPCNVVISNYGRIRNMVTDNIYKNTIDHNKVYTIFTINSITYSFDVAILLAYLKYKFIRNRYIKEIIFKDNNKFNITLNNIEANFSIYSKSNPGWKEVEGCPDYLINCNGEVARKNKHKLIKTRLHKCFNVCTVVDAKGNKKSLIIAREVAKQFVQNPFGFNTVAYKDNDRSNCKSTNLVWVPTNKLKQALL